MWSDDIRLTLISSYTQKLTRIVKQLQTARKPAAGKLNRSIPLTVTSVSQRCVPEDWDQFHVLLQQLLKRVPALSQAVLHRLCNGLEAFSPDCKWIVGEAPEVTAL